MGYNNEESMIIDTGYTGELHNDIDNEDVSLMQIKQEIKDEKDGTYAESQDQVYCIFSADNSKTSVDQKLGGEQIVDSNVNESKDSDIRTCKKRKRKISKKSNENNGTTKKPRSKGPKLKVKTACNLETNRSEPTEQGIDSKSTDILTKVDLKRPGAKKSDMCCNICNISFPRMQSLRKHMFQVHNEKAPDNPVCDKCNMIFKDTADLEKHNKVKHELGVYKCNICQREYDNKISRASCQKKHRGRVCKQCGEVFQSNNSLNVSVLV